MVCGGGMRATPRGGALRGAIAVGDTVREGARAALDRLRAEGARPIMLTGDNAQTAQHVAEQLGGLEVIAEVLPEDALLVAAALSHHRRRNGG